MHDVLVRLLTWTKFRTGKIPHLPLKNEGKIPHQIEIRNFPRGKIPPRNFPLPGSFKILKVCTVVGLLAQCAKCDPQRM